MLMLRRRDRDATGAAAVEFGLIAPLLLMLVMGIIDFGWMLLNANLVNNTARDAARVASLNGSYSDISASASTGLTRAGINTTQVTTQITCTNATGTNCDGTEASYTANATSGSRVLVTISYTHRWITPFGALCDLAGGGSCTGNTILLQRTATMVRE